MTSLGEDVDSETFDAIVGVECNWCYHYGKQYGGSQKFKRTTM